MSFKRKKIRLCYEGCPLPSSDISQSLRAQETVHSQATNSHGHQNPLILLPQVTKVCRKLPRALPLRWDPPALQSLAAPAAASHGRWSLPRQRRSHVVVQMYHHRLYFSALIAGLDALAISQPKPEGRGLQLECSASPVECALRTTTGPSFSILANTEGLPRAITFLWLFLFSWEQPCRFLEWNHSTGSHWPWRRKTQVLSV